MYDKKNYPDAMKTLSPSVRERAIRIANRLIEKEKMNQSKAVAKAIDEAIAWSHEPDMDGRLQKKKVNREEEKFKNKK